MASAGKILMIPKGDYAPGVQYKMLDIVNHDGATYIAKKDVFSVIPGSKSSEDYWQPLYGFYNPIVHDRQEISQQFNFMYVAPKEGYHLASAMVLGFTGDSDIIQGIVWQDTQYVLITKAAPPSPVTRNVHLTWVKA